MSEATHLTRQQYRALAATAAGWYWDWLHSGAHGESVQAKAWRERTEEDIAAEAVAECARLTALYAKQPQWTEADAVAAAVPVPRLVRAVWAVETEMRQAEERKEAKRIAALHRRQPCGECGWGAVHGHARNCGAA